MRRTDVVALAMLAAMAGGCNRSEVKKERAFDAAAKRSHYEPPATLSRAEYGGIAERRFHQMDRNGDGYISADEWPHRPERFTAEDTDHDGRVSPDEFGHAALARFDARDTNGDGTVTQPEWIASRRQHAGARTASR